jgi:farnesyl-diphosphate farnesyltransferase
MSAQELNYALLRSVSRSFYLTLRILPAAVRPQIGLAYLLARTTDTIADTELVSLEQRLAGLQALREQILGSRRETVDFGELARQQGLAAERVLLEKTGENLALLQSFQPADQKWIRDVLSIITSGQELDLRRFDGASAEQIVALQTDSELDDYTYRVAGCVGEFWTKLCRAHLFPKAALDERTFLANGVRFGKGLQLVNILRDLPVDLRKGRCYLPADDISSAGLTPADLLNPANEPKLRPLYRKYLDLATGHLSAGWTYTNTVPRRCARVRLACAWPLLIGQETLELLRRGNVLDPQERIKVTRSQVRRIILRSLLAYPSKRAWERLGKEGSVKPQMDTDGHG